MIYLVNKKTNEVVSTYINVIKWNYNFVEFDDSGRCKIYCDEEIEYFTNIDPLTEVQHD